MFSRRPSPPRVRRVTSRALALTVITAGLAVTATVGPATAAAPTACPTTIDTDDFASAAELGNLTSTIAGFGLRLPGSTEQARMTDWVQKQVTALPGMNVSTKQENITRWQPTTRSATLPGRDLARAGGLKLVRPGNDRTVTVAGAVPDAAPTTAKGKQGRLTYLPPDEPITAANSRGKVVIRDVQFPSVPYSSFSLLAHYISPDLAGDLTGSYDRPFLAGQLNVDMTAADKAGAAGVIMAWTVPNRQIRGYYDPHEGTSFDIPAVFVGVDQAQRLKKLATKKTKIRTIVRAKVDEGTATEVRAVLPGQTTDKVVLVTHTDGNTWVQENGSAGLIALARYLTALPLECRTKTYEFAFTTGHLRYSQESTNQLADDLDDQYDAGDVSYVWAAEHLGTRRVTPVDRPKGPGQKLVLGNAPEDYAWFAGNESPVLSSTLVSAVRGRDLTRTAVLRGFSLPAIGRAPSICSFGGIGTTFHSRLIPTLAGISGPWSLWAPTFGKRAVDFTRMRDQVLVVGDSILALDDQDNAAIGGAYPAERARRAAGAATCNTTPPPTQVD